MRVLFRPEAEDELVEAIDWYDLRSPGLGEISSDVSTPALSELYANPNPIPSFTARLGWVLFAVSHT